MPRRAVSYAFAMMALVACGGSDLKSVLREYGYAELRPPSNLLQPGTIIRINANGSPGIVCSQEEALGQEVKVLSSDSKSSDLARNTESDFSLDAKYLAQIKTRYQSVENVKLSLHNTKVFTVTLAHALEKAKDRSAGCKDALDVLGKKGVPVTMVQSVLQADVDYAIDFKSSASVEAQAQVLKDLSAKLGGSTSQTTTIKGAALYWGLIDDPDMIQTSSATPNVKVVKVVKDPATGAEVKVTTLLGDKDVVSIDANDLLPPKPVPPRKKGPAPTCKPGSAMPGPGVVNPSQASKDACTSTLDAQGTIHPTAAGWWMQGTMLLWDGGVGECTCEPASTPTAAPPSTSPATPPTSQKPTPPTCPIRCEGSGEATRLRLEGGRTYRFELRNKTVNPHELHVHSEHTDNMLMNVEKSSVGDAFTISDDALKVCSKLARTGGGCHWSCSVDSVKGTARLFTDQLSADFTVSCP